MKKGIIIKMFSILVAFSMINVSFVVADVADTMNEVEAITNPTSKSNTEEYMMIKC